MKEVCMHTHTHTMEYHSTIKKKITPFSGTCMGLETVILSEVIQTEKDKYHMVLLICRMEKRVQMNLSKKQIELQI